jgi:hypothetical protein
MGDAVALAEAAKMLVAAENPVIVAGRVQRTAAGPKLCSQLADTLQAPVVDERSRMNMPIVMRSIHTERGTSHSRRRRHPLALEPMDLFGTLNNVNDTIGRPASSKIRPAPKVIVLGTTDVGIKANITAYERYNEADLGITGDAEASHAVPDPGDREGSDAGTAHRHGDARSEAQEMSAGFMKAVYAQARRLDGKPDLDRAHLRRSVGSTEDGDASTRCPRKRIS